MTKMILQSSGKEEVFSINGAGPIQYSYEKKYVSTPTSHYTQKSIPDYLQS